MDIKKAIQKVIDKQDLSENEMFSVFTKIMSGQATEAQIAAFIVALRIKGETATEIAGAAKVMRKKALKVKTSKAIVLDTCGTGGSGLDTFNISTCAAFIIAASGVKVAKHGNRGVCSKCGSADVLEKLGVKIEIPVRKQQECLKKANIAFLFAPLFHGAMKYAVKPRREVGVRTIFNVLGPLCNPAGAKYQVLGVYDRSLIEKMAKVLKKLKTKHAFVVSGADGLDEVTVTGKTCVSELKNGRIKNYTVSPKDFGVKRGSLRAIKGGSASKNAGIILNVLKGKKSVARDIVLMNAGLGLVAAGKAKSFKDGRRKAEKAIDSGEALSVLKELINITNGKKGNK